MSKYVRFEYNGRVGFGVMDQSDEGVINELDRDFLENNAEITGRQFDVCSVKLLAPVCPANILAIGLNYKPHASEANMKLPDVPLIFIKATTAVAGDGDDIVLPAIAPNEVDYEGELAIVIGKTAKNVSCEDALEYVFGYTVANDVSARDCQLRIDTQWARGKSFDTFCPIGPCVATGLDASDIRVQTRLNGKVMQDSKTSMLIFDVAQLVSYCSRNMTLLPGTLILTGTPDGVGFTRNPPVFLREGDEVRITIENVGTLTNTVVAQRT